MTDYKTCGMCRHCYPPCTPPAPHYATRKRILCTHPTYNDDGGAFMPVREAVTCPLYTPGRYIPSA